MKLLLTIAMLFVSLGLCAQTQNPSGSPAHIVIDSCPDCITAGGSGTVTSVSDLAPLFTTATRTTTPAFSLTNSAAHTVFGNNTAGSAAPAYFVPACADLSNAGAFCSGTAYSSLTGTPTLPANTTATASNFFTAYNSATGAFTKAQPAFTDISGVGSCAQEPAQTGDVVTSGCAATIQANAVTQTKVTNGYVDLSTTQASIGGAKTFTGADFMKTMNAIQFADQYSTTAIVTPPALAPVALGAATGGTVAANNYKCEVTFVGATSGETTVSPASASLVTTGATSTLYCQHGQIPPPAGALTYNVYWQTAGAGSYFLGHSAVALNVADVQTTTPATSGTTPPGANTSLAVLPSVQAALSGGSGAYVIPGSVSTGLGAAGAPVSGQTIFDFRNGTIYTDPPNGGTGLLITDAGLFNNVEQDLAQISINGFNSKAELNLLFAPNFNATQGITAGGVVSASSTTSQFNGVAGYAVDLRANPVTPSVGVFGSGRAAATNARVWGGNFVGSDMGFVGTSSNIYGIEPDCFVQNTGSLCTAALAEAFWLGGIQPTTSLAFRVGQPQGSVANAHWSMGYRCDTNATIQADGNNACLYMFPVATGNTQVSQGITFLSTRSDGAQPIGTLYQLAPGDLQWLNNVPGTAGLICGGCNSIRGNTVNQTDLGTTAIPFVNMWLGAAATNNIKVTGTATAARIATFPDTSGNVLESPAPLASTTSGVFRVTGDFTDASSTALQTITGLSFVLPANTAYNYSVECHLQYSQATNVADAFGIQAASLAPTSISGHGLVQTTATTAFVGGSLTALTTTTATNIVAFTPTATGVQTADLYALIENPSGIANTINIMVSQSTAADVIVIKKDSYCRVY